MTHTLHWYFSLGTTNLKADYILGDRATDRLKRLGIFKLEEDDSITHFARARSVTTGLLHLLGQPSHTWHIRLRCVETEELREMQFFKGTATGVPRDYFLDELPSWMHTEKEELQNSEPVLLITERTPKSIEKVVSWLINEESEHFKPGDAVFFEATSGLRPFQMAMCMGAELLKTLNPHISVVSTLYAEFKAKKLSELNKTPLSKQEGVDTPEDTLTPIYDMSELLHLPTWASAAKSLQEYFNTNWLTSLIEEAAKEQEDDSSFLRISKPLQNLNNAFGLGWVDRMIQPLHDLSRELGSLTIGPAWSAISPEVKKQVKDLLDHAPSPQDPLSMKFIDFHLLVADKLIEVGRNGDALRVLREVLVTRMVLKQAEGEIIIGSGDQRRRRLAERALFISKGELNTLWSNVTKLRNRVSHGNTGHESDDTSEAEIIETIDQALDPQQDDSLQQQTRRLCEDENQWHADQVKSSLVIWLTTDLTRVVDSQAYSSLSHYLIAKPIELTEPDKNVEIPTLPKAKAWQNKASQNQLEVDTKITIKRVHWPLKSTAPKIRGKNWLQKQWKSLKTYDLNTLSTESELNTTGSQGKKLGFPLDAVSHLIFCEPPHFEDFGIILHQCNMKKVLCWMWDDKSSSLRPLFDQSLL